MPDLFAKHYKTLKGIEEEENKWKDSPYSGIRSHIERYQFSSKYIYCNPKFPTGILQKTDKLILKII